jgi:hypothetical protein
MESSTRIRKPSSIATCYRRVAGPNHRNTAYAAGTPGLVPSSEGRYVEAKPLMQESVRIDSKNGGASDIILAWYNFACAAALVGQSDEALDYLRHVIDAGLRPSDHPENDSDLKSLRANPRFTAMVQDLQKRAGVPAAVAPLRTVDYKVAEFVWVPNRIAEIICTRCKRCDLFKQELQRRPSQARR